MIESHTERIDSGAQPIVSDDENLSLAVNGEIYNHRILRKQSKIDYNYKTHSDCEVIIPLVGHPVSRSKRLTR
jgi:asparagine synthase (glutamine-hydrolysing)